MTKVHTSLGNGNHKKAVVYYKPTYGEFVVRFYFADKLHPPSDYFTSDRKDAIETANQMVK